MNAISSITLVRTKAKNLPISMANKTTQFSNNIYSINVVSTLQEQGVDYSKISNVKLGSNMQSLLPSCFINCTNLKSVTTYEKLKDIQDCAFMNCTNLKDVTFLKPNSEIKIDNIGVSAFANSGLENVTVRLRGTTSNTQVQEYAFANCQQLTSMTNKGSNFLADYEFANCSNLKEVHLANSHSYMARYPFLNCTSLQHVEIPPNTWGIGEGMFKGCTNLTSIEFQDPPENPSQLGIAVNSFGNFFLSGAAITSLTFPSATTSITALTNNALAGLDNLSTITFNGISINDLAVKSDVSVEVKSDLSPGKMFIDGVAKKDLQESFKKNGLVAKGYDFKDYFDDKYNGKELNSVIEKAISNTPQLPVLVLGLGPSCGRCVRFCDEVLATEEFLNWMKSSNNKYTIAFGCELDSWYRNRIVPLFSGAGNTNEFVQCFLYYEKDGKVYGFRGGKAKNIFKDANTMIGLLDECAAEFNPSTIEVYPEYSVVNSLYGNGIFGLRHDVTIISKEKISFDVKFKDIGGEIDDVIFATTQPSDKLTIDNFKYGQWYYNASLLKPYVDSNFIPTLAISKSQGCPPCETFNSIIFGQHGSELLKFCEDNHLMLCYVNAKNNFYSGEPYFIMNNFMSQQERAEGVLPILMMYWNNPKGGQVITPPSEPLPEDQQFFPYVHKKYAHFNDEPGANIDKLAPNGTVTTCISTYQQLIAWITQASAEMNLTAYEWKEEFVKPPIDSWLSSTDYPKYSKYANQDNDNYGRYYPTWSLIAPMLGFSYTISVRNSSNVLTEYSLSANQTTNLPPIGTYQCFTMVSDDNDQYEANWNLSGIIFKVGKKQIQTLCGADEYDYSAKTLASYQSEYAIDDSTIANYTSSFFYKPYMDTDGNLHTDVVNEDAFEPDEPWYNIKWTFNTKNIIKDGHILTKFEITTSSDVQLVVDPDEGNDLTPTGNLYVVKSNVYETKEELNNSLAWLSVFNNFTNSIDQ